MRKIILFTAIILTAIVLFTSCKKELPDYGSTTLKAASNGWWATFTLNGADVYGLGHFLISTYNTSAQDSLWVDDLGHSWQFKCKAKIDPSALTFSTTNAPNEYYAITVTLTNGKILPGAGKSRAGNTTDSIYMQAKFSDDPTTTYTIAGTARTGFIEDDY